MNILARVNTVLTGGFSLEEGAGNTITRIYDAHQRSSRADFISLAETTLAWQWIEQSMQNLNPHVIHT